MASGDKNWFVRKWDALKSRDSKSKSEMRIMTLLQDRMTVSHLWFDSTINDVNTSESQSSASPRPISISFYFIHSFIYLFVYSNNFVYS